jgi:hypothetical protein
LFKVQKRKKKKGGVEGEIKLEFAELCNFPWKGGVEVGILLEIVLILLEPVPCPILMQVQPGRVC